jgi:hypothetical protein
VTVVHLSEALDCNQSGRETRPLGYGDREALTSLTREPSKELQRGIGAKEKRGARTTGRCSRSGESWCISGSQSWRCLPTLRSSPTHQTPSAHPTHSNIRVPILANSSLDDPSKQETRCD